MKCIAKVYISANIHVYCLLLQLNIFCCVENSIIPGGYLKIPFLYFKIDGSSHSKEKKNADTRSNIKFVVFFFITRQYPCINEVIEFPLSLPVSFFK